MLTGLAKQPTGAEVGRGRGLEVVSRVRVAGGRQGCAGLRYVTPAGFQQVGTNNRKPKYKYRKPKLQSKCNGN